jgi:histidyl-tRNA synthetase
VAERKQFRAIKGVRDILPPESALWNRVEQTARDVFATYGFQEIRLPVFEQTELFARSVGEDTDIVGKEMYSFSDEPTRVDRVETLRRQEWPAKLNQMEQVAFSEEDGYALRRRFSGRAQSLTLRPEATASVVRAYIEHGMHSLPGDVKLYYMGPMFRRERPQRGRYRQFYQIGAELLGQSDHPAIDAEVIEMLMVYLERLGLAGATLYINSIGCKECRPAYVAKLREGLIKVINQLGADSQRRIETNPLRVLDSKLPDEQAIIEKLPRIGDHLCAACLDHFAQVQQQLKQRGIACEINWRLVRGLDYYMRTTFEITAPGLGAQNAICGGGRYDGLVELLGGPPTKGIGFAIGTDRLVLALQGAGKRSVASHLDVYLAWIGAATSPVYAAALQLARRLRAEGLAVELPAEETKLKKALGLADRLGARYAVLLGEDEMKSGTFVLRRMADGEQKKLSESELIAHLKSEPSAQSAASG